MSARVALLAAFAVACLLLATLALAPALSADRDDECAAKLVQVQVLHVRDEPFLVEPQTLIEHEDGQRERLPGYYGEPGDTFMREVCAEGGEDD